MSLIVVESHPDWWRIHRSRSGQVVELLLVGKYRSAVGEYWFGTIDEMRVRAWPLGR